MADRQSFHGHAEVSMWQFKQPTPQPVPLIETSTLVWSMLMVFFGGMVLLAATLIRL